MSKRLTKGTDQMLCGVCSGLAEYFDIDVTIIRIVWVILVLTHGAGIIIYIILALLMPEY